MKNILFYDLEALTDKESKDWQYHFNLLKGNLTDYINQNNNIIRRQNAQLKNLKEKLQSAYDYHLQGYSWDKENKAWVK